MKTNSGIETLLLLCCLVGVVAFFSLGIGLTNALIENPTLLVSPEDPESLESEKKEKEDVLWSLEEELEALREKKAELTKRLPEGHYPGQDREKLEEELDRLEAEYDRLIAEVEKRKSELAELSADQAGSKQAQKQTIRELENRMKELEELIEKRKQELARLEKIDRLVEELRSLERKRKDLEKQVEKERVESIWKGNTKFKDPFFIECKTGVLIFYPEKRTVAVADVDDSLLKKMAVGHDGVVILIRPDGFESFERVYEKVQEMSLRICYEPIEDEWNIDFLEVDKI